MIPLLSRILFAQNGAVAAGGDGSDAAIQMESLWDFVVKGGPMMIPIGIGSLIAMAVVLERLVSLRRGRVIPAKFLDGMKEALKDEEDGSGKALAYCQEDGSPVASIFTAGIKRLGRSVERLEKRIQEAGEREVFKLRKNMRLLSVVAAVSPLMGLLGTIFGMIKAFQTVATHGEALGKASLLARGIYEAMITTAAGLLVAIPVLVAYHWLSSRIDRLVGEMDLMTVEFVEEYGEAEPADESSEREDDEDRASPIKIPASAG